MNESQCDGHQQPGHAMRIEKAEQRHIEQVARLFDLYRQFYQCDPDLHAARTFITERIERGESDIFVARIDDDIVGFTQLYPSFCSVELMKIYILYDLYVDEAHRRTGIGDALMDRAARWARENDAGRIDLLTAHDNHAGQRLYERKGYEITNQEFHAYAYYVNN
ncbi:MAG: GNAT family N-acetyltransferase [Pseudomonadota bacterium]